MVWILSENGEPSEEEFRESSLGLQEISTSSVFLFGKKRKICFINYLKIEVNGLRKTGLFIEVVLIYESLSVAVSTAQNVSKIINHQSPLDFNALYGA